MMNIVSYLSTGIDGLMTDYTTNPNHRNFTTIQGRTSPSKDEQMRIHVELVVHNKRWMFDSLWMN